MAVTPYRVVSWEPDEVITVSKMRQLADNQQWLFDNMPRARYTHGVNRNEGVKLLGGYILHPASTTAQSDRTVYFGEFFTMNCRPAVSCSIVSNFGRVDHVISGIGVLLPDHRGFVSKIRMDALVSGNNVMNSNMYVGWLALGY